MAKDKISYIIGRVNNQLVDDGFIHWPKDKLLESFNDAQRAVVTMRPDANVVDFEFTCVQGTRQSMPDDAVRLIDVLNTAAGYAIRSRDKKQLTELYPEWYGTVDGVPEAFVYDERQPKFFFLFPGVTVGLKVDMVYSAIPPVRDILELESPADLDSVYSNAIIEYMLYMAHSKDFEYSEQVKAQTHFQMFMGIMGAKTEADTGMSPTAADRKE